MSMANIGGGRIFHCAICGVPCIEVVGLQAHTLSQHANFLDEPEEPDKLDTTINEIVHSPGNLVNGNGANGRRHPRKRSDKSADNVQIPDDKLLELASKNVKQPRQYEKSYSGGVMRGTYQCSICDRSFRSSSALKYHVNAHIDNRRYSCDFCGKRFCQPSQKKQHELVHTDEKPHSCSFCPMSFRQFVHLQNHIRAKHTGETPFRCTVCIIDKAFTSVAQLYNHKKTAHNRSRPFECEVCKWRYATLQRLQEHDCDRNTNPSYMCSPSMVSAESIASVPGISADEVDDTDNPQSDSASSK